MVAGGFIMEQNKFEILENDLSVILCQIDKIETVAKVLNQTLLENCEYEIKDSQNLCSLLIQEITSAKNKLNCFENSFSNSKTSCR